MPFSLLHYFYSSGLSKYQNERGDGSSSWALVTGASDGIGRALCDGLAAQGFSVVLHGRNEAKLARVRRELQTTYPRQQFRIVAVDASAFTQADIEHIVAQVSDIPLTVLINNVGGTAPLSSNFKRFEDTTSVEIQALYSLNTLFPLQLTRAILPRFQQAKTPTLILTCGSQSYVGSPFMAAYSSCKGALHAWNRALAAEQHEAGSKVEVLEVVVGATYTQQLQKDERFSSNLFMPVAEKMAPAILAAAGHGFRSMYPYFWHSLQQSLLYGFLPGSVADSVMAKALKSSVEKKQQ